MTTEEIKNTFRYHSPNPDMVALHEAIREHMTATVVTIAGQIPPSRERSMFITLCQQAQMMANAACVHEAPLPRVLSDHQVRRDRRLARHLLHEERDTGEPAKFSR